MENAVKALLIAAGVMIGVMILTLGISLFTSLNQFTESAHEIITSKELQKFNEQFVKYINCNGDDDVNFKLTIQDIVTAANTAYENNQHYGLTDYKDNNYYVIINLDGIQLEKNINSQLTQVLENGLGKEYKCRYTDVKFNEITGRVYEVNFHEISL